MQPLLRIFWRRAALALLGVFVLAAGVRAADDHFFHFTFGNSGIGNGQFSTPVATALDPSRSVYVVDYNLHRIQRFDANGGYLGQWGSSGSGDGQFNNPSGIAVDTDGNVYVTDQHNHRIQKFTSSGAFITKWGSFGTGNGQFQYPTGIAIDASSNVYVTDFYNYRVQKFTSSGAFITKWGSAGTGNGQFNELHGIAVDAGGNVYVGDRNNYRVQKFTSSGAFITKWGSAGTGDGQFAGGYLDVAVDAAGDVYVTDSGSGVNGHRVQKFRSDGTYAGQFGGYGSGANQFNQPFGISVDSSGRIYIADASHARVSVWQQGQTYLPCFRWGSAGAGDGQFALPQGVALDSAGNVYVADTDNQRIQKFDNAGNYLAQWGSFGSGNGQFQYPWGIVIDGAGNVYVADQNNHRVQKFDSAGNFLSQIGGFGSGNGQFAQPRGLGLDSVGNLYVADRLNHRIQKFDPSGNYLAQWGTSGDPFGVAVDSSGNVFVVSENFGLVQKFDSAGNLLLSWGSNGTADGKFNVPAGVGVDASGNVYVADQWNYRIQKFDGNGHLLAKWGTSGGGDSQLEKPFGVVVHASGKVYIADTFNHRISVWIRLGADCVAPTVLAALVPTPNAAGWNHTNAQVQIGATDNAGGSGVQEIHYRLDGGMTQTVVPGNSANIDLTSEGTFTVTYFAKDNAGNQSDPASLTVKIDKTAPTTTATPNASATQMSLAASDTGGSGVDKTYYKLDGASQQEYSGPISLPGGPHSLEYWSVDVAGNEESHHTTSFTSDDTAPTTTANPSPAANANGWNKSDVQVSLSAQDNAGGSGVQEIHYSLDGGMTQTVVPGSSAQVNFTSEGIFTLSFFARDNLGNSESAKSLTIRIDKTAPVTNASLAGTQVTLSASDTGGSGVDKTYYQVNGGMVQTYSAPFNAPAGASVSYGSVDVAGNVESSKTVNVPSGPVQLVSVSVTPNPMGKNASATGTVRLNQNAPVGGVLVYLFASKSGVTVPVTVTIPAGYSSKTFPVVSGNVSVLLTITANSAVGKKATNLTVQ